jgi:hypothetical protein
VFEGVDRQPLMEGHQLCQTEGHQSQVQMNNLPIGLAGSATTPTELLLEQAEGFFNLLSEEIVSFDLSGRQGEVIGDPEAATIFNDSYGNRPKTQDSRLKTLSFHSSW